MRLLSIISLLFILACSNDDPAPPSLVIDVVPAFSNLTFSFAVDLQNAGDASNRIFVADQVGRIFVFDGTLESPIASTFLDITDRILANDRFGLLGFTFDPNYSTNGYVYVHYNASGPDRSVISRFTINASDSNLLDDNSEFVILEVNQPHKFHNGGQLAFGPDGYLYIILGDGGPYNGSPDPDNNGQDRTTLHGSMLRIDVSQSGGSTQYTVPADNPFFGDPQSDGSREEIYAWGMRNPWRFSFDPLTSEIWAGENGEDTFEEIIIIEKGKNYGWKIMEGDQCFSGTCDQSGLELPVWQYGGNSTRRSVIAGHVYRGDLIPELEGKFIYADFLTGFIWTLEKNGSSVNNEILKANFDGITSFGLDEQGEIYMTRFEDSGSKLYKIIKR